VDSVALSWVLLGPLLALLRPFSALVSAITAGLLVGQTEQSAVRDPMAIRLEPAPAQDACDSGTCCDCGPPAAVLPEDEQRVGLARRALDGLRYAFSDLLDDLVLWLVFGILAAGMVVTLVPPGLLAAWGSGLWAMLLILLISVPMYVCATASTPLAHAMLFAGVSPGTVLVFLLAGPASNLAGLLLVRRELGSRALTAYLVGVAGISVALGLGLDWVVALFDIDILAGMANSGAQERELPVMLSMLCLLLLAVAAIRPFRRYLIQGKAGKNGSCCD
jgi:uncharacterized membrane protein YraQ (UPF0718 family)